MVRRKPPEDTALQVRYRERERLESGGRRCQMLKMGRSRLPGSGFQLRESVLTCNDALALGEMHRKWSGGTTDNDRKRHRPWS